ncbi:hypothetical protein [Streptomyces pactum]|uniref:hypothetical protein n=1 Tax=Streptomyces pactum TaxID=68249 RepID=UPI000A73480D|nr:hypothetical protein [Streptomyces pactum]
MTALATLPGGPTTTPAIAAPRPLVVRTDSAPVPLDRLAHRAGQAAADGGPGLRKGTHVRSWSLGMSDDEPPITLPEERVVRWTADGRHTELVVATDPRHPGRPVLGEDEDGTPRPVEDGHVISRQTNPPSWSDAPPESRPPHDTGRLRAYLEEARRTGAPAHRTRPSSTRPRGCSTTGPWAPGSRPRSPASSRTPADCGPRDRSRTASAGAARRTCTRSPACAAC